MKKRLRAWSLAKKVYWITAVGFLAFTALFMVLQLLFFEDYSLKVRAAKLEKDFHGMYEEIRKMKSDSDWLERIAKFDREHYSWTIIERKEGRIAKLLTNWPDEGTPPYLNCITPSLNKLKDVQGRDGTAVVFLDGEGDGRCWAALAPISEEGERQEYIYVFIAAARVRCRFLAGRVLPLFFPCGGYSAARLCFSVHAHDLPSARQAERDGEAAGPP